MCVNMSKPWKQHTSITLFFRFCHFIGLWTGRGVRSRHDGGQLCQDCADSHASCRHLMICIGRLRCSSLSRYVSFPSYFYWPLKSLMRLSSQLLILSHFLGVPSQLPSLSAEFEPRETRISRASRTHTFHNFNHTLYFPFPPSRSQHDLTTLLPPPKRITASASPTGPLLTPLCAAFVS